MKPILNEKEPIYIYLKKLKEYTLFKNKDKYNLILEFINKFTNFNITSLCDFKDIDEDKINLKLYKDTLDLYKDKLEAELQIEINEYKMDMFHVLSLCLKSINYSIHKKTIIIKKKNLEEKIKYYITITN